MPLEDPTRRAAGASAFALALALAGSLTWIGASHAEAAKRHSVREFAAPLKRSATSDGLTITLTASPDRVNAGASVRFLASASTEHATGALGDELSYGDSTSAPPVALPQFCLAPPGHPAQQSWHFTHRYASAGTYRVKLRVFLNCGAARATVALSVTVVS